MGIATIELTLELVDRPDADLAYEQRTVASAPFPTVSPVRLSPTRTAPEPERPIGGHLERRRHYEERLVMEVVEMVSDYLVEWKPGGAGLRLDDRRRSILVGEVAVDRIYLETIGQLRQQLFRPLGLCVVATERRFSRNSALELEVCCTPMAVVGVYCPSVRSYATSARCPIEQSPHGAAAAGSPAPRGRTTLLDDRAGELRSRVEDFAVANDVPLAGLGSGAW